MDTLKIDLRLARQISPGGRKTQWAVAKGTEINQAKISLIEHGYVLPTEEEKKKIAGFLGFKIDDITWPDGGFVEEEINSTEDEDHGN